MDTTPTSHVNAPVRTPGAVPVPAHRSAPMTAAEARAHYRRLAPAQRAGIFVWPSLRGPAIAADERALLRLFAPTGVVLFRRSMIHLAQARTLVADIKDATRCEGRAWNCVVAIDEEGGRVSRLPPPFARGQAPRTFGDSGDRAALESQVLHQAFVARGLGIGCLFAPVADILTVAENPALGDRSFGADTETVAEMSALVARTFAEQGLLACAKHFPGHGNTATDTHHGFAHTDADLETLRTREWVPFKRLFAQGVPMCMTGHIMARSLDPDRPATLSHAVLTRYLRQELGFAGLIVSDDMRMNAISDYYQVKRAVVASATEDGQVPAQVDDDDYLRLAAVDALKAGCDLLLSCQSIVLEEKIFRSVAESIAEDAAFDELCEEKAVRVLTTLSRSSEPGAPVGG